MIKNKVIIIIVFITILISGGIFLLFLSDFGEKELKLVPKEREVSESVDVPGTEVGTGWSNKENPGEAVKEAITMALKDKENKSPDFAIIFASSGSDLKAILSNAKKLLGDKTKIYGGTSDSRAVMTNKGFIKTVREGYEIKQRERALAIMTITSDDIIFGVGSADLSAYPTAQEASISALRMAINSAGKTTEELPKVILVTPTLGQEEEILEGLEKVVGENIPILGGTAGGPRFGVFGEKGVYSQGVSLVALYTDLPIGWNFEGGFDVRGKHSGTVTKVVGQAIVEIDHKPALEVYDEWLGGQIKNLFNEGVDPGVIRDLLILHPIYRKYNSPAGQDYFLFSHPWPKDETLEDKSVMTSTKLSIGERIYLSHGTWETLINRIEKLPQKAKAQGGIGADKRPILGIGYICAGVMGIIPEEEREKMPFLINYSNKDAPFISNFTWGEQGHFPGICNKHGNLLTSFLVIGEKGSQQQ